MSETTPDLRAQFFNEVDNIFAAHEDQKAIAFREFLIRNPAALSEISGRRGELWRLVNSIRTTESDHSQLVHKVEAALRAKPLALRDPDTGQLENHSSLFDIFKSIKEENRPLLDATAYKDFIEAQRFIAASLRTQLPELDRRYNILELLKDYEREPLNAHDERGLGNYLAHKNIRHDYYARVFVGEPGQETLKHNHEEHCISLTLYGLPREYSFASKHINQPTLVFDEHGNVHLYREKPVGTTTMATPFLDGSSRHDNDWHIIANPPEAKTKFITMHFYFGLVFDLAPDQPGKFRLRLETRKERPSVVGERINPELTTKNLITEREADTHTDRATKPIAALPPRRE